MRGGKMMNGGPGSRGGKVIGKTRSGKPIYAPNAAHSAKYTKISGFDGKHQDRPENKAAYAETNKHVNKATSAHKYTKEDHEDAEKLHRKLEKKERDTGTEGKAHMHGIIADTHGFASINKGAKIKT